MNFSNIKKIKLEEIETLDREINHLKNDRTRTSNTNSLIRLIYERKRKMQELMRIFAAEEADFTRLDQRDGRILDGLLVQHAENVHGEQEHII